MTFNTWNVFLNAYPDQINSHQEFHVFQPDQWSYEPTQLPSILTRLSRLDTSLVTLLCVRDFSLTFDHLKAVINIPTLAAMILEQAYPGSKSGISARQFLDFGRAVRDKKALQKLRLLVMCNFRICRKVILEGASTFPSLHLVGLHYSETENVPQQSYGNWVTMTPFE
jgi:hypothetical protein